MKSNVIDFKAYKRAKGIALPRSPYSTLAATREQIDAAFQHASDALHSEPRFFAALVGYENIKTGKVKLLKGIQLFSNREVFELWAGIRGHYVLALTKKEE